MATPLNINTSFDQLFFMEMKIGDIPIIPQNVNYMVVREWCISLMPTLNISINDDGMLSEIFTLQDEMPISILVGKTPQDENPVKFDFMLIDYKMQLGDNKNYSVIEMTGVLNIPELFSPIRNKSYKNKNSKNVMLSVLGNISSERSINTNIDYNYNPTDTMTWLQVNQSDYQFMLHVLERSYARGSVPFCYFNAGKSLGDNKVDSGFSFNLTTLDLARQRAARRIDIFARYNVQKFSDMIFENEQDQKTVWFNYYDVVNLNGTYNHINNYGIQTVYYDLANHKKQDSKLHFKDSTFTDNTFKHRARINNIVHKMVFSSNNNVHKNYHSSIVENKARLLNLFGYSLILNVNSLTDVKLCDILIVHIPQLNTYESEGPNAQMSGKYIVVGKVYSLSRNNVFRKQLIIARDGINKSGYDTINTTFSNA